VKKPSGLGPVGAMWTRSLSRFRTSEAQARPGALHRKKHSMRRRTGSPVLAILHFSGSRWPLVPIACGSVTAFRPSTDCNELRACAVRLFIIGERNAVAASLDNRTLAELRAQTRPREPANMFHIRSAGITLGAGQ
jgi:hypothetical protein